MAGRRIAGILAGAMLVSSTAAQLDEPGRTPAEGASWVAGKGEDQDEELGRRLAETTCYEQKTATNGKLTCADEGLTAIDNENECSAAMQALGLVATSSEVSSTQFSNSAMPPGCAAYTSGLTCDYQISKCFNDVALASSTTAAQTAWSGGHQWINICAVSYTHLTLPTILLV